MEILESSQFLLLAFDPHSEKGKEELDSLFTPSQVENFQVFTNPLFSEEVKVEALQTGSSSLFSAYIPFTGKVLPHQPKSNNFPPSSKLSSTNQSSSSSATSSSSIPKMVDQPMDYMDRIVAARYAPLVMPQPLHALPGGDYQKYLPRFNVQGDTTAEEHWNAFFNYANNQNIESKDVWMRMFVQSLDGEVRKWFWELHVESIDGIEVLEEVFMKQWGDTKYFLYYIIEFGALKRKRNESVVDFSKIFNKMYSKFPAEIKPS